MLEINYNNIDSKCRNTIESIERKPHVKYIRYLLSKRYSPIAIKMELQKMGLSAPHEPHLTTYFFMVIEPLIKANNVAPLYADYKNKLLKKNRRGDFAKHILNFRLDIAESLDDQANFCKLIRDLDIEDLWISEIYRFYGSASRMPVDETGKRILSTTTSYRNHEKILLCEKRYMIDKLIMENIPDSRIAKYCQEKLGLKVYNYDVAAYKRVFFNIKTQDLEDKIRTLETEKNSLDQFLKDLKQDELDEYQDATLGDKSTVIMQTEERIKQLSENIKVLNSLYSDFANHVATHNNQDFEAMFADITVSAYQRYKLLDKYNDRDIVDPLFKVVKMMGFAHDKMQDINIVNSSTNGNVNGDVHSKIVTVQLCKQRLDEVNEDVLANAKKKLGDENYGENISPEDIGGVDELAISFDEKEE